MATFAGNPPMGTLTGAEIIPGVQSGADGRTTTGDIARLASAYEFPKLILPEGAAPPTPSTGQVVVYAKSDGKVYAKDDTGAETLLGSTGGGGSGVQCIPIACSDETTALAVGTGKVTFRMPYAFTLSEVRASLTTAQTSGSIVTIDINEGGASILSTKLTIDNTEKTSKTAATAAVMSDTALADDAEITIDIDQLGDGTAKGLKVYLIGSPT